MALYRGPFLEGFSLRDAAPFDDWCLLARERLHRQAIGALRRLARIYEGRGESGRACEAMRRAVELEPWQEEAHRELIRLLALDGQRSAALGQYESCRRTLMEDLGIEPTPETKALYERIRDGVETPALLSGPRHNLRIPLHLPFCGSLPGSARPCAEPSQASRQHHGTSLYSKSPTCQALFCCICVRVQRWSPAGGRRARRPIRASVGDQYRAAMRPGRGRYFWSLT